MAKDHQGIINIPKCLVTKELKTGELIPILEHLDQRKLDISLLYPNRRYLSPKVKVFIDFLTTLMKEQKEALVKG